MGMNLPLIVPVVLIALAGAVCLLPGRLAIMRATKARRGFTLEEFVAEFGDDRHDRRVVENVYRHYQDRGGGARFLVNPDDSLEKIYGEGREDIDDDVRQLLDQGNIERPSPNLVQRYGKPISSVRDVVEYLCWLRVDS